MKATENDTPPNDDTHKLQPNNSIDLIAEIELELSEVEDSTVPLEANWGGTQTTQRRSSSPGSTYNTVFDTPRRGPGDVYAVPVPRRGRFARFFGGEFKETVMLVALVAALVSFTATDAVLVTRVDKQLQSLAYVPMLVYYPISFVLALWPIIGIRYWYKRRQALRGGGFWYGGSMEGSGGMLRIRDPSTAIKPGHWRHFTVMALCDGLTTVMTVRSVVHLAPPLLIALGQLSVPATMIVSFFYLRRRYRAAHVLAALGIVAGVLVNLLPAFDDSYAAYARASGTEHNNSAAVLGLMVAMVVLSMAPKAFGHAYADRYMKREKLDPALTTACVATIQLCLLPIMICLIMIPVPKPAITIPPVEMGHYFRDATRCFAGLYPHTNTSSVTTSFLPGFENLNFTGDVGNLTAHTIAAAIPAPAPATPTPFLHNITGSNNTASTWHSDGGDSRTLFDIEATTCQDVPIWYFAFLVFNLPFNVLHMDLVKRRTANFAVVVGTLRIGFSDILFAWPWLAGPAYRPVTARAALSLIIVVLNVLAFALTDEIKAPDELSDADIDMQYLHDAID